MRDPEPASLRLRLQARADSALLLRQRLGLWLEELGAAHEEIFDLSLAATEAFENAVEHPIRPEPGGVEVEGTVAERTVTVTVHDHGRWREERQQDEGGFGLAMMRWLVDTVDVQTGPEGTAITLQRRLRRPDSAARVR